jgi:hypothetical protein
MNVRMMLALTAALTAAPLAAHAQASAPATPGAPRREQAAERREKMQERREAAKAMTPEQREAARARAQERFAAMPPEQQQFLKDQRAYSQGLREKSRELRGQVESGAITREAMAEQLRAYRDANRPARPEGARKSKPTP